jgi:hypothetical protein
VRIERKVGATVAVTGSLLLALSGAIPALASSSPSAGQLHVALAPAANVTSATSTTFAGWVFGASATKSVTSEFKVPALKCTSKETGDSPGTVVFTGSSSDAEASLAALVQACVGGKSEAVTEVAVNDTVKEGTKLPHTGDVMEATVTLSSSKITATLADVTKGHTFKLTLSGSGGSSFQEELGTAKVEVESSSGKVKILPVSDFGKITFTDGAIGGKAIGGVKPQVAVNMVTKKVLEVSTGKITGSKKNSFVNTWKHA